MAITLPFPVRVAAGIVATGIALVRSLPEELPAIPVALVGNAMRLSMKVQQEITTLATRGDELLGGLVGGRPQESPEWATFDEDTEPARPVPRSVPTAGRPTPVRSTPAAPAPAPAPASAPAPRPEPAPEPEAPSSGRLDPEASSLPDPDTTALQAAIEVDDALIELATHAVDGHEAVETGSPASANGSPPATPDATAGADEAAVESAEEETDSGPAVLPGYDGMTLAQVRGHLRELAAADVSALLDYEQSASNRAPFLTLLSNRLVTLGAQES